MILVDTSVWIDYLNGVNAPYTDKLDDLLSSEIVTIADLIYMEVLQGISDKDQFNKTKKFLDRLNKISISGFEMALKAAMNYNTLRLNGITIRKSIDVLIGTYCHESGCRLLHNDKDFDHFSECIKLNFVKTG